jgi:hypothetical protein
MLCLTGCDDGPDDYDPPAGYGALSVDNQTSTDIYVYVDGLEVGKVGDFSDKHFDLTPGIHRVVLDEHDGSRNWRMNIDILDDRLTILKVTLDTWDNDDYNVSVDFE